MENLDHKENLGKDGAVSEEQIEEIKQEVLENVSKQGYVNDENYTHTDNNYTNEDKQKLIGLKNYDDTDIQNRVKSVEDKKADKNEIPDVSEFIKSEKLNDYTKITDFNILAEKVEAGLRTRLATDLENIDEAGIEYINGLINNKIGDIETLLENLDSGMGV